MKKYELELSNNNIKNTILDNVIDRNRKLINIIKLLNSINENFIISIDGSWGTGKTFFVKQLVYLNKKFFEDINDINKCFDSEQRTYLLDFANKYSVFYYNAWQNDDHIEPLESIIYNILNEYPKIKKDVSNPKELFQSIKPILINIICKGTNGIITEDCFNKLESFEELASNIHTIEEKKQNLDKLLNKIIPCDKRILLIIDELDRCNPNFAVKMIETIKHFYNNSKISIIVTTYNKQLAETIKHFYGNNFDGYSYLNKIYDTTIELKNENLDKYIKKYCNIYNDINLPENISYLLFNYLNFSYRECNKYMTMYNVIDSYIHYKSNFNPNKFLVESSIILPIMLALKIRNIDEYDKFLKGDNADFIVKFVDYVINQDEEFDYVDWMKDLLNMTSEENNIAQKLIDIYKKVIKENGKHGSFPYLEAITLLGNQISAN